MRLSKLMLCTVVMLASCDASIAGGLDEDQANEIVVALDGQGISALKHKEDGVTETPTFRVEVSGDDVGRALHTLQSGGLPRHSERGIEEVFGAGGLVPTATEERARYTSALSGELARSLETMDGILDARVHLALPETRDLPLDAPPPHPRASVLLKYRRGPVRPYDDAAVRAIVAGAVQGMETTDVAVVGMPAAAAPTGAQTALVRLGPIAVTRGSAGALKMLLGGSIALNVLVALGAAVLVLRRKTPPPSTGSDGDAQAQAAR